MRSVYVERMKLMQKKLPFIILITITVIIIICLILPLVKTKDIKTDTGLATITANNPSQDEEIQWGDPGEVALDNYNPNDDSIIPNVKLEDSTKELADAIGEINKYSLSTALYHMSEEVDEVKNAATYSVLPGSVIKGNNETTFTLIPDTAPDVKVTVIYNSLYSKFYYKIE